MRRIGMHKENWLASLTVFSDWLAAQQETMSTVISLGTIVNSVSYI